MVVETKSGIWDTRLLRPKELSTLSTFVELSPTGGGFPAEPGNPTRGESDGRALAERVSVGLASAGRASAARGLAESALARRASAGRAAAGRGLAESSLARRASAGSVLAGRVLARRTLVGCASAGIASGECRLRETRFSASRLTRLVASKFTTDNPTEQTIPSLSVSTRSLPRTSYDSTSICLPSTKTTTSA